MEELLASVINMWEERGGADLRGSWVTSSTIIKFLHIYFFSLPPPQYLSFVIQEIGAELRIYMLQDYTEYM